MKDIDDKDSHPLPDAKVNSSDGGVLASANENTVPTPEGNSSPKAHHSVKNHPKFYLRLIAILLCLILTNMKFDRQIKEWDGSKKTDFPAYRLQIGKKAVIKRAREELQKLDKNINSDDMRAVARIYPSSHEQRYFVLYHNPLSTYKVLKNRYVFDNTWWVSLFDPKGEEKDAYGFRFDGEGKLLYRQRICSDTLFNTQFNKPKAEEMLASLLEGSAYSVIGTLIITKADSLNGRWSFVLEDKGDYGLSGAIPKINIVFDHLGAIVFDPYIDIAEEELVKISEKQETVVLILILLAMLGMLYLAVHLLFFCLRKWRKKEFEPIIFYVVFVLLLLLSLNNLYVNRYDIGKDELQNTLPMVDLGRILGVGIFSILTSFLAASLGGWSVYWLRNREISTTTKDKLAYSPYFPFLAITMLLFFDKGNLFDAFYLPRLNIYSFNNLFAIQLLGFVISFFLLQGLMAYLLFTNEVAGENMFKRGIRSLRIIIIPLMVFIILYAQGAYNLGMILNQVIGYTVFYALLLQLLLYILEYQNHRMWAIVFLLMILTPGIGRVFSKTIPEAINFLYVLPVLILIIDSLQSNYLISFAVVEESVEVEKPQ